MYLAGVCQILTKGTLPLLYMHRALKGLKIYIFTTYAQMHQSFWYSQALFQTQMHTSIKAEREETGHSLRQHAHGPSDAHYKNGKSIQKLENLV